MDNLLETYADLIVAALEDETQDPLPAVQQYLRVAKSEGLDPEKVWAEVQDLTEDAPEYSEVAP